MEKAYYWTELRKAYFGLNADCLVGLSGGRPIIGLNGEGLLLVFLEKGL